MAMQLNPYSAVASLPSNSIASLLSGAGQSADRMRTSGLGAIDALRSVGMANENELYNTKLTALQNSPEFLNANPMQRQAMVQSASSGLELDKQNLTGQEQLFKTLGQEQENLNQVARDKTANENALELLGMRINADENRANITNTLNVDEAEKGRTFKAGESDKQRIYDSAEAEKIAKATKTQHDIRNNQVFQLVQDNEGNYYKTTVGGDVAGLGVKGLVGGSRSGSGYEAKASGDTLKYMNMQTGANKEKLQAMFNTGEFRVVDIPFYDEKGKHIPTKDKRVFEVYGNSYPDEQLAKEAISKGKQTTENVNKQFDANAIPSPVKKLTEEKNTGKINTNSIGTDRYTRRLEEANAMRAKLGLPPIK